MPKEEMCVNFSQPLEAYNQDYMLLVIFKKCQDNFLYHVDTCDVTAYIQGYFATLNCNNFAS